MTREEAKNSINEIDFLIWQIDIINNTIDQIFDEHEAQLKAKDEEIKGLGCRIYHAEGYISDLHNNQKDKKFYDKKARSIVAMLFWEWRKAIRETNENRFYMPEYDDASYWYIEAKEKAFVQAHKMLKDTQ